MKTWQMVNLENTTFATSCLQVNISLIHFVFYMERATTNEVGNHRSWFLDAFLNNIVYNIVNQSLTICFRTSTSPVKNKCQIMPFTAFNRVTKGSCLPKFRPKFKNFVIFAVTILYLLLGYGTQAHKHGSVDIIYSLAVE